MRHWILLSLIALPLVAADAGFNGRWDIRVPSETRGRAWWLEVSGAGTSNIKGRFVGAPGGDMNDIPEISIKDGELKFVFERKYQRDADKAQRGVYRARLVASKLEGVFEVEGAKAKPVQWVGVRAPLIKDKDDGTWKKGRPVELINGRDLSGWRALVRGKELGWTVKDGAMTNVAGANNLVSERKFWNFELHVEYRLGEHSNSGIGLRGRYEVQILEDFGRPPDTHSNGALYSRIPPRVNASKPAGEWQTYDIRLVGRTVTIVLNGQKVIDKGEIEGLTAMAHDPDEGVAGPISLQGDHGPVEFRKITLTPLEK